MLDPKIVSLITKQVNNEFFSAYLYLDFANYYEHKGLKGFANWFKIQAQEERDHGMLMYQYLHNNNELVELDSISRPNKTYEKLDDPLHFALAHECGVTAAINWKSSSVSSCMTSMASSTVTMPTSLFSASTTGMARKPYLLICFATSSLSSCVET